MNNLKNLFKICLTVILLQNTIYSKNTDFITKSTKAVDWTFIIYMEAGNPEMHYWAQKNLAEMALAKSESKNLNIVTQVHIDTDKAWRYVIRRSMLKPIENVALENDCVQNLVNFVQFSVKKYPAKHYCLILWGEGFGVLDPQPKQNSNNGFAWDIEPDEPDYVCTGDICPIKNLDFYGYDTRAILFDGNKSYMTNSQFVSAIKTIKETVLKNKNIDILGTDCCKMGMIEAAYQLKDFANFLIGSQNCELADGWNYLDLFSSFKDKEKDKDIESLQVIQTIMTTYESYYKENTKTNSYTLCAIDLSQTDTLAKNLNSLIELGKKLMDNNKELFKNIIINTRKKCPSMCDASYYVDLGSVYANLYEELNKPEITALNNEDINNFKNALLQNQNSLKSAVVGNVTGSAVKNFQGLSIYFPINRIDASYLTCPFAQETAWLKFLNEIIKK
ncbi:MAG: clostripain-related cysteine peptidase [Candidatus Babeliales bacterium]